MERGCGEVGQRDRGLGAAAASHGQDHGRGRGRVVADLALHLGVGVAVALRRHRYPDPGQDLARLQPGRERALVEIPGGDPAVAVRPVEHIGGAQALHDRRHVVARIAAGAVAAEGADVADLRVGNLERGLAQDRQPVRQQLRRDDLPLGGHGADHDLAAVGPDALERRDAAQIDQIGGLGEAQLHHRHQAVAAGQRPCVLAELGEQHDRLVQGRRTVIVEVAGNHGPLLPILVGDPRPPPISLASARIWIASKTRYSTPGTITLGCSSRADCLISPRMVGSGVLAHVRKANSASFSGSRRSSWRRALRAPMRSMATGAPRTGAS